MEPWNLADALDLIAEVRAEQDALIQRDRRLRWREVERRARNVAAWMLERGGPRHGKVAVYSYNHPAYLEAVYAAMKAALVPVNVNYRYRADELRYLLLDSDAEFVVVHEDFASGLTELLEELPKLRGVLVVGDPGRAEGVAFEGAADYEVVAETDRPAPAVTLSGDDLVLIYTGGTTGKPKGAMWRQQDLYERLASLGFGPKTADRDALRKALKAPSPWQRILLGPPLMHGTGWFSAMVAWLRGGTVLLLDDARKFRPDDLWRCVERHRPTAVAIVGDPFAKPMLQELRNGRRYDLSSIEAIVSSGVIWSQETKQGLLEFHPGMALVDIFSSSEYPSRVHERRVRPARGEGVECPPPTRKSNRCHIWGIGMGHDP